MGDVRNECREVGRLHVRPSPTRTTVMPTASPARRAARLARRIWRLRHDLDALRFIDAAIRSCERDDDDRG